MYHTSYLQLAQGEILVLLFGILRTNADTCDSWNLAIGTTLKNMWKPLFYHTATFWPTILPKPGINLFPNLHCFPAFSALVTTCSYPRPDRKTQQRHSPSIVSQRHTSQTKNIRLTNLPERRRSSGIHVPVPPLPSSPRTALWSTHAAVASPLRGTCFSPQPPTVDSAFPCGPKQSAQNS